MNVAAAHGHTAVILGAWGCRAFGNDWKTVAPWFHEVLTEPFQGVFERGVFAVTDRSKDRCFIGPFEALFGDGTLGQAAPLVIVPLLPMLNPTIYRPEGNFGTGSMTGVTARAIIRNHIKK